MSKAARITLVIISLTLFLGIPALAALRIWDASNTGTQAASSHFASIVNTTERASGLLEAQDYEPFAQDLRPLVRSTDGLAVLVIAGAEGRIDYAWSRREARLPERMPDLRLQSNIPRNEPWERRFDARVEVDDGSELLVSAVYETLEQGVVYRTLRDALLAILAFALLVLIVLIGSLRTYEQRGAKDTNETPAHDDHRRHTAAGRRETSAGDKSSGTPDAPRGEALAETASSASEAGHESDERPYAGDHGLEEQRADNFEDQFGKSERDSKHLHDSGPSESTQESETPPETRTGSSPPLVSPDSGLSFENHLPRRLSLELERTAENNLDLSLLVVRVTDVEGAPVASRLLGTLILEQFPFEDLAFEYSPAGACIILTGIDLDTALRKAERLQALLRRHELGRYRVRAGASSRNGRLVESERLIREATEALSRADSQSFAVGFRPDPDRYRSYIASKTDGIR